MFIPLSEVLEDPVFRGADPVVLASEGSIRGAKVRWVHATELLDVAQLLRGGEMLLSTGQELLRLREEAQIAHLQALSERGISALVMEPFARHAVITPRFINAAEQLHLPLIRLRNTVPFVDLAERINRAIVSKQAATLQQADKLSQRLAQRIAASGPNLTPLLQMVSDDLGLPASMQTLDGHVIATSDGALLDAAERGARTGHAQMVTTDIFVGGDVAAHLLVECHSAEEVEHVSMMAQRLGSIIGLAYAQHHRPSRAQLSNHALMHAIIDNAGRHYLAERALEAGLDVDRPVCMAVVQSHDLSRVRAQVERVLQAEVRSARTSLQNNRLYFLVELDPDDPRGSRSRYIARLREALQEYSIECAVGPAVPRVAHAPKSLEDALMLDRFPTVHPSEGRVRDASEYALERLFAQVGSSPAVNGFVDEVLGDLLEWDRVRRGELVPTLYAWLSTGCNATATAAVLYLERQTLHKRLKKIYELLGGDPRGTDKILHLHLACRIQMTQGR